VEQDKFEEYLNNRYQKEIKYYDDQACRNKLYYYGFSFLSIILSSITSVFLYLIDIYLIIPFRIYAFITSTIVSLTLALISLFNFHEKWMNYRTTCESLKKELHYYNAKLGDYSISTDPEALFIERVEEQLSKEHTRWLRVIKAKE
jgi:hypothetical protein